MVNLSVVSRTASLCPIASQFVLAVFQSTSSLCRVKFTFDSSAISETALEIDKNRKLRKFGNIDAKGSTNIYFVHSAKYLNV